MPDQSTEPTELEKTTREWKGSYFFSFHFISLPVWVASQKTKSSKSNGTSTGMQQKHKIFSSNENQATQNKSYSLLVCTKLFSLRFFSLLSIYELSWSKMHSHIGHRDMLQHTKLSIDTALSQFTNILTRQYTVHCGCERVKLAKSLSLSKSYTSNYVYVFAVNVVMCRYCK